MVQAHDVSISKWSSDMLSLQSKLIKIAQRRQEAHDKKNIENNQRIH